MIARKTLILLAVIFVTAIPAVVQAQDATLPPRELKIGTYTTQGTMYRGSRREIARRGNRVCIKRVDGIPTPYRGYSTITVSSISVRSGKLIVDATNREMSIKEDGSFDDGTTRGTWKLLSSDIGPSKIMDACLAATDVYGNTTKGEFLDGSLELPGRSPETPENELNGREGVLTAKEPGEKIIVYTGAGTNFEGRYYGVVGERVIVLDETMGKDSHTWYQVQFPQSDTYGWIRSDFIRVKA